MPPRNGTSILIGEDLFSFPLSKVERQLQTWGSKFQVRDAACAWSDLLGFGTDFVKSGWKPNPATWQKIAERLQAAYSIHLTYPALPGNFMLLLNDGVVRTIVDDKAHAFCWPLASWVRDVVWAHVDVTSAERAKGYPGTRTIVTGGEHANYGLPAATMDDFASLATKEYPVMTKAAQAAGNPTIASNPAALQMNTAFSKAYILDDYGSEVGINGCGLFVDDSFFELVRAHIQADHKRFSYVEETRQDGLFRGVKDANSDAHRQWMMRFALAPEPIKVAVASLSTTVWRVEKFYPWDGIPPGSSIDVPWYPSPPKKTQNPPDGALHPRDSEPAANTHVKHDPGPPPPPLLLSKGVTVESFRKLIASKDDNAGSHVLWVDHAGTIHLDLLREGQSAAAYEDEIAHRMRFRYEAFGQGEGLMGPAAVEDVRFARDLLHIVERDWFHRTRGCVESF